MRSTNFTIRRTATLITVLMAGFLLAFGLLFILSNPPSALAARLWNVEATTHTVGADCGFTIQECIAYANPGDTVVVPAGTYTEGLTLDKSVSLVGEGTETTILQAPDLSRILTVTGATIDNSVVISGMTFTGGDLLSIQWDSDCPLTCNGGAIVITDTARPLLTNLIIRDNDAKQAGGIYAFPGSPLQLVDVSFLENRGFVNGVGGLYAADMVTMTGVIFQDNIANQGSGGGAYLDGGGIVRQSHFQGNAADNIGLFSLTGGGIYSAADLIISESTFTANTCYNFCYTGGMAVGAAGALYVSDSIFTGNGDPGAYHGGAIYVEGPATVEHSTFTQNSLGQISGDGGAIYAGQALTLTASTFISNTTATIPANGRGSVYAVGPVVVADSRFEANIGGALTTEQPLSVRNSAFVANLGSVATVRVSNNQPSSTEAVTIADSRFVANQATGLLVERYDLTITNTDFISNTGGYAGGGVTAEDSGPVSIFGGSFISNTAISEGTPSRGGALDITYSVNSVTIQGTQFISNTAEYGGGAYFLGTGPLDIRDARFQGNRGGYQGGGISARAGLITISGTSFVGNIADGSAGGANLVTTAQIQVTNSLFQGNQAGIDPVYFSAEGGGIYAVRYSGGSAPVQLSDTDFIDNWARGSGGGFSGQAILQVSGGQFRANSTGDNPGYSRGGAVYNYNSSIVMTGTQLLDNRAYLSGGAIDGNAILFDVLVENNIAETGNGGGVSSLVEARDSVFLNNQAGGNGGGATGGYSQVAITSSRFEGNQAGGNGGALATGYGGDLTDTVFQGNIAGQDGGGLYSTFTSHLQDVTFLDNQAVNGGGLAFISVQHKKLEATNLLAGGNTASGQGAGFYLRASTGSYMSFNQLTVANASTNPAEAIYYTGACGNFSGCSHLRLRNSIIANHAVGIHEGPVGGVAGLPTYDVDYVLFFANTQAVSATHLVPGSNSFKGNPAFLDPASADYHLGAGSAALDNGDSSSCPATDLDGAPRPQGLGCDRGAYEQTPQEPVLQVVPTQLQFIALPGWYLPFAQPLTITNDALGVMTWNIQPDQNWLSSTPTNGQGDATVDVNMDITGLGTGEYQGQLTVNASVLVPSKTVAVDLDVLDACLPLVPNGDFEFGPGVGWSEINNQPGNLIRPAADIAQITTPRPGDWAVILGSENGQVSELSQQVKLPSGGPLSLTYYYHIDSTEFGCSDDRVQVRVDGQTLSEYTLCQANNTAGWVQNSLNLTAYASQEIELAFHQENDALGSPSVFLLDDITFGIVDPAACSGPQLQLSTSSLSFSTPDGSAPSSQSLTIASTGAVLNWTAQETLPWLDLSTTSGTTPATLEISVDTTGLVPAVYDGQITIQGTPASVQSITSDQGPQLVQASRSVDVSLFVGAADTYTFTVIAQRGQDNLTGFEGAKNTSIDDTGRVAFVGLNDMGNQTLFSGDGTELLNLTPGYQGQNVQFGPGLQMGHKDNLITLKRSQTGNNHFSIREYSTTEVEKSIIWESVDGTPDDRYSLLHGWPSISPIGHLVFTALNKPGSHDVLVGYGTQTELLFAKRAKIQPMVAQNGWVAATITTTNRRIMIFDYNDGMRSLGSIAIKNATGFSELGHPAISDDGRIVVFHGDLTQAGANAINQAQANLTYDDGSSLTVDPITPGPGVFAAVHTDIGWVILRMAGLAENGQLDPGEVHIDKNGNGVVDEGEDHGSFTRFYTETRPSVGKPRNREASVSFKTEFLGKPAIFSGMILYKEILGEPLVLARPSGFEMGFARSVVDITTEIPGLNGKPADLCIYDALNNRGDVAFWVRTTGGDEAVVRASGLVVLDGLEVTQAVQDWRNSVPLVEGKRTFVRAHVSSGVDIPNVEAILYVRQDSKSVSLSPLNPGQHIDVITSPVRRIINDSFYFELPQNMLSGTIELELEGVKSNIGCNEKAGDDKNNDCKKSVTFVQSEPLRLVIYNVLYTPSGFTYPFYADDNHINALESWLKRAYPISTLISERGVIHFSGLPSAEILNKDIENERQALINFGGDPRFIYYGMVDDRGGFMQGGALGIPSDVASGPAGVGGDRFNWDDDGSYADWYGGHEIGHTRGRYHAEYCEADYGMPYPYTGGRISPALTGNTAIYGFDITTRAIYGPDWKDVMTYCNNQWISDYTYEGIRTYLVSRDSSKSAPAIQVAGGILLISGSADLSTNTGELESVFLLDGPGSVTPPDSDDWTIALQNASGDDLATYPFSPQESTDHEESASRPAIFVETVPDVAGLARIEIRHQDTVVDSRLMSPNPPSVNITSPQDGQDLDSGAFTFAWDSSDLDGDPLTYMVFYSHDNGISWDPFTVGPIGNEFNLDTDFLPGGSDSLLKVIVSDGFRTDTDIAGPFTVPQKNPDPDIETPQVDTTYWPNQLVVFSGTAYDPEDGHLNGVSMEWSSDIDGLIGTGILLSTFDLSIGTHTITLKATDSDGKTSQVQRTITIVPEGTAVPVTIAAGPFSLSQAAKFAGFLVTRTLSLRSSGAPNISWRASVDVDWAELSVAAGTTPSDLTVTFDPTGLALGAYSGVITVESSEVENSPLEIPIFLYIEDPPDYQIYLPTVLNR